MGNGADLDFFLKICIIALILVIGLQVVGTYLGVFCKFCGSPHVNRRRHEGHHAVMCGCPSHLHEDRWCDACRMEWRKDF